MSDTFWMFPEGVAKLTAQIDRARADAEQAKAHVTRHCTLSLGEMGLLPDTWGITGVHRKTVQLVERTLDGLARRAEYVVDGIQASVADYQTVDDETSQVFSTIAAMLPSQGSLPPSYSRYGLTFPGVSFSDLAEPTDVLRDPGTGAKEQLWQFELWSLNWFIPSSYVREFVREVAGRDVFQDVTVVISGDWMLFQRAKWVWVQLGTFCKQLGKNLARAAYDLRDVWKGREAEAAERYLLALANTTTDFSQFCRELVAQYSNAETAAQEFNEVASGALADIATNTLLGIAARSGLTAGPLVTRAAAASALALLVVRIGQQVVWVADKIEKVEAVFHGTAAHVNSMEFTGLNALAVERSLQ